MDAGNFRSKATGRIGRGTKFPPQFGHAPPNTVSAHRAQKVHSKVQITASKLSGGRSLSQHSQFGLSFIMSRSSPVLIVSSNSLATWPAEGT